MIPGVLSNHLVLVCVLVMDGIGYDGTVPFSMQIQLFARWIIMKKGDTIILI